VRGELSSLWAGYGGGAGGNAGKVFPNPNWTPSSDEKGGGGGGGGGALQIQALGKIVFGAAGVILSNGGSGATGENTNYFDHIGGTGGAGSGGHIVLESATAVDFTDGGQALGSQPRDILLAAGPRLQVGPTQNIDNCGNSAGQSPLCCPGSCQSNSNGGAGGAGLIQLHVPDPLKPLGTEAPADIRVPAAALAAQNVLDQITSPPAYVLIPTFGKRSQARSKWISIGGADQKPDGSAGHVRFFFDGIDSTTGRILTLPNSSIVQENAPLVSESNLASSTKARILPDGFTLELSGQALAELRAGTTSGVSNDVYLRTPALLENCSVRMRTSPANFEDFAIASASYDEGTSAPGDEFLRVRVGGDRPLTAFNPGGTDGTTGFLLLPRFFQVITDGLVNSLPTSCKTGRPTSRASTPRPRARCSSSATRSSSTSTRTATASWPTRSPWHSTS
jgi:hypothetical protein